MSNSDPVALVAQESGLPQNKVQELMANFGDSFQKAHLLAESSKGITVTSEDQVEEMSKAREARMQLKKLRVNVENTRKELKEQSLREGKAIDGAANIIKALIVPVEEHLEKQEKFAEELAKRKKEEKLQARKDELGKYVSDISVYDLENLSNETYNKLLEDAKKAKEAQLAAEKKAEEERVEKEKAVQLYNSRKDQLIPYWNFLHEDHRSADFSQWPQEQFDIILREAIQAKNNHDAEQEQVKAENERLRKESEEKEKAQQEALQKERAEREKLEQELRDKKAAEEKKKQEEEERIAKEKAAAEEAKRQADLAPDKEKMRAVYKDLQDVSAKIELMVFENEGCHQIAEQAVVELKDIMKGVADAMKAL